MNLDEKVKEFKINDSSYLELTARTSRYDKTKIEYHARLLEKTTVPFLLFFTKEIYDCTDGCIFELDTEDGLYYGRSSNCGLVVCETIEGVCREFYTRTMDARIEKQEKLKKASECLQNFETITDPFKQ